jgi:hypothetical protein
MTRGLPTLLTLLTLLIGLVACAPRPDALDRLNRSEPVPKADAQLFIVHCLFPGQVRRLGAFSQGMSPRRAAKVNADECAAGGGEFVSPQTDPLGALRIWLPFANEGDADAQVTVGELYEAGAAQGSGLAADPALAARWYERALAQGSARAMVNLASLHERGLGVPRDAERARELMRRAGGLVTGPLPPPSRPQIQLVDPPGLIAALRLRGPAPVALALPAGQFTVSGRAWSASGIAELRVNGEPRPVDASGLFSARLALGDQPQALRVRATDRAGISHEAEFSLVRGPAAAALATAPAPGPPTAPNTIRYALVIANQAYRHWERLDTPIADGRALAGLLRTRYGFQVTMLADATRRQVLTALNELRAKVDADDEVLVYYAGHGEMDAITARGYWIPVDGDKRDLAQWISVIDVTDQLAAMRARRALVIADSCYSGTLGGSLQPRIDEAIAAPVRRGAERRARVAMTSGGLEPVVDGGGGANSIYARSLIEVLTHLRQPAPAQELHDAVSARFAFLGSRLKLAQQPMYAPIAYAGHEAGDFMFVPLGR